ncbi:M48 family metallopeptidase [Desulfuribacillus alkaliarsenatis]|uniref:YgjP-like metallopeptidase domain-containing protein n=1 Tax=Desulfuribacillus alkaliarsenatis TaxID=766136 RepID=A0A1E5G346_9FIRM|nr:SprT family zinc-dependent metalloprotease [Desulfuribacillus alkaliarsenatis]OEF97404.1 hypothetical protein BHF68_04135 [Desulfuribacillus alkaliarsenatis]
MPIFKYKNANIRYTLIQKPKLKNISIRIEPDTSVTVKAPSYVSIKRIEEILNKKAPWILKKLDQLATQPTPPEPKQFKENEQFAFLGTAFPLSINVQDLNKSLKKPLKKPTSYSKFYTLDFNNQQFILTETTGIVSKVERSEILRGLFKQWYIKQGMQLLVERLDFYTKQMGVSPTKVVFKEQKKRWGSCTSKGAIYLNWRLMMAPITIIDYVIVHELAHLKHLNHSKDFWYLVQSILPDHKERRNWLKLNGATLTIG